MTLQQYAKSKIAEFGGLDYFLQQLEYIKPLVPENKQFHIEEIRVYYELMYLVTFDMEKDYVIYVDRIISAKDMFGDLYKQHGNMFAKLMHTILSEGYNKTKKIKMIS